MTKDDLIRRTAAKSGVETNVARVVVEAAIETTMEFISNGDSLFLRGFGTFQPKLRKAKTARNISKNTLLVIPAHKVPHFKPSPYFKNRLK